MVQPAAEPEDDEPGGPAVGGRQVAQGVHVVDELEVRLAVGSGVGIGQAVQLPGESKGVGEIVAGQRTNLDASRTRHGKAADRAVGVAEVHGCASWSG